MAMKLYEENDIQNIANELRRYNETDNKYRVEDMTLGIQDIAENIENKLGTTKTVEGINSLEYENAKAYRILNAEYQGNVKQDSTTGKNLLNIDSYSGMTSLGVTNVVSDKKIVSNGTATSYYFNVTSAPAQNTLLKAGTAYTFSIKEPTPYQVIITAWNLDGSRASDFLIDINQRISTKTYDKDVKLKHIYIAGIT